MSDRAAAVRAWRWAALGFAAVVAVTALVVSAQPVRSPWWTYADADASYTASALNLMLGQDVSFVDHPGLPITEAVAVAFAAQTIAEERSFSDRARLAFVDRALLDLDSTRGTFRGFAVVFYLAGAVLSFFLAGRLFGHWTWGLAAGVLWLAAPGLVAMSIQLRPDVLLAVLCAVFAFAVARALERRAIAWYAAAAAVVGFAAMVKVHALALLPALALAAVWRPAEDVQHIRGRLRSRLREHTGIAVTLAVSWGAIVVLVNGVRMPFSISTGQLTALVLLLALVAGAVLVGEAVERSSRPRLPRLAGRGPAVIVAAFAAGLLLPVTVSIPEGLRALVYMANNVAGRGVQEGVDSFATPFSDVARFVNGQVLLLFWIAAFAAFVGVTRRDPRPVVWTTAAVGMGVMAFARPPNVHYFAPSFVLALFAVLWLLQREPRTPTSLLVWPVVLWLVWPAWTGRDGPAAEQRQLTETYAAAKAWVDEQLGEGEVAVVPSYAPFADSRFFELVQIYVDHAPEYPYRYVPATTAARPFAAIHGWRPRYFVGSQAVNVVGTDQVQLGDLGAYTVRQTGAGGGLVLELVRGPGVTEPW